jgi:hypothetical protein
LIELPTDNKPSSTTAPRSGDGGRPKGEPSVREAKGAFRPRSDLSGRAISLRIEDEARHEPVGVSVRTPDRQQAEFDDSAAKRRWRSPYAQ